MWVRCRGRRFRAHVTAEDYARRIEVHDIGDARRTSDRTGPGKLVWASCKLPGVPPGARIALRVHVDTPIAVHWHYARGPSLQKLARLLPARTDGRITLTTSRPS
ncbi:hypothetical protein AA958_17085 [Streptomyces sp. CNQ-509]|uniref:hypothetical protein n=1 Tax=unclassified Streptomyces TaxID=2593676 RepID=UPI00062DE593|nr:hypothetical protein [Streptomyces sp. CNQ-509]AKH83641.1 hypothetical protein AA958_17085 [Streptomyces sp. CNQ-509]